MKPTIRFDRLEHYHRPRWVNNLTQLVIVPDIEWDNTDRDLDEIQRLAQRNADDSR